MPWNPDIYHKFKNLRSQPFFDLMAMIVDQGLETAIDLGCGTGELTSILSNKFKNTSFLGIDTSLEMLEKSKEWKHKYLNFKKRSIAEFIEWGTSEHWDLIFSNAALHWSDHHEELFPKLISKLNWGGQLAVQMPVQNENLLNQIILELVQEQPYASFLNNWKRMSSVLTMDAYAQLMFENGLRDLQLIQKVYPVMADSPEFLLEFISGSTLVPYMERLSESEQSLFTAEIKKRIEKKFKRFPAIYAFKRLLLYGKKE